MPRLDRITCDMAICHGQPTVRGLRYPVEMLLGLLASGMSIGEVLEDYEDLERDDLLAALEFGGPHRRLAPRGDTPFPVKFLVDAQLTKRLATKLDDLGHDAIHTLDLPRGNRTSDRDIIKLADEQGRVVVTKDRDFRDSHLLTGEPEPAGRRDRQHPQH